MQDPVRGHMAPPAAPPARKCVATPCRADDGKRKQPDQVDQTGNGALTPTVLLSPNTEQKKLKRAAPPPSPAPSSTSTGPSGRGSGSSYEDGTYWRMLVIFFQGMRASLYT